MSIFVLQRQRAAALWEPVMAASSGRKFSFSSMLLPGTWEYKLHEDIPALTYLQGALQQFLGTKEPPSMIEVKRSLGLPRYEGVVDIIHTHKAFFDRKVACQKLDDVAYNSLGGCTIGGVTYEASDVCYAQV